MNEDWGDIGRSNADLPTPALIQDECFVNCFSEPPTLLHMAAVSIAVKLWTEPGVIKEIISISDKFSVLEKKKMAEERILNRLLSSSLPVLLKTEVSYVLQPVQLQVLKCFHQYHTGYRARLREYYMNGGSIYFTMVGTVDFVKSLKELFIKENSEDDVCSMYEAACFYCLEECLPDMWKKIPADRKNQFTMAKIGDVYQHHLVLYWTSVLEGGMDSFLHKVMRIDYENIYDRNHSVDINMVTCSIYIGNISALKHFWNKLTKQEKTAHFKKWLLQVTKNERNLHISTYQEQSEFADVLCFLLSHVSDKTELVEFFQNYPGVLMLLFQTWPSQTYFLSAILEVLAYLQEDVYVLLMEKIGFIIGKYHPTRGYEVKIFMEIFHASPSRLKMLFLHDENRFCSVVLRSIRLGDLSMAYMLLNEITEEEKKRLIFYMFGFNKLRQLLYLKIDTTLLWTFLSQTSLPPEVLSNLQAHSREMKSEIHRWSFHNVSDWHICEELIYEGNYQAMEKLLEWAFLFPEEIQSFKKTGLDPFGIYIQLIIRRNYERISQFLDWYFETKEEIRLFHTAFLFEDGHLRIASLLDTLELNPSITIEALEILKRVSLCSSIDISQLKGVCLNHVDSVLRRHYYELATELLNWSLHSPDEIVQYKNDFVLSDKGVKNLLLSSKLCWRSIERLINWSAPLFKETVKELKSLILEKEHSLSSENVVNTKVTTIFYLLDAVSFKVNSNNH